MASTMPELGEVIYEERYAQPREAIFKILESCSNFNQDVLNVFMHVFREYPDYTHHGPILWAIMVKGTGVKRGVLGTHFKVYLQYYYHTLVLTSQRKEVKRPLDLTSLAFLTCVAGFGYSRGSNEFDKARKLNDVGAVNGIVIDRPSFLTFFWPGNVELFSLCGSWQLIDRLWDVWDSKTPIKIHGFITGPLSFEMLGSRIQDTGAFAFRFSSQGGVAIDYVEGGVIKKTLWKYSQLPDSAAFIQKLYDPQRDGPYLKFLIDTSDMTFGPKIHPKETAFPLQASVVGYSQTGYARVDDDDGGSTQMNTDTYIVNFMGSANSMNW